MINYLKNEILKRLMFKKRGQIDARILLVIVVIVILYLFWKSGNLNF